MRFRAPFSGSHAADSTDLHPERSVARAASCSSSALSVVVFIATMFFAASSGRCAVESSYEDDIVSVSLEPVAERYYPGDRVVLKLKIVNKSAHNIAFYRVAPKETFRLTCVRDKVPAVMTQYGLSLYSPLELHRYTGFKGGGVFPSETREYEIEASRFYDMSMAGTYTFTQQITLRHQVPDNRVRLRPEQLKVQVQLEERSNW